MFDDPSMPFQVWIFAELSLAIAILLSLYLMGHPDD